MARKVTRTHRAQRSTDCVKLWVLVGVTLVFLTGLWVVYSQPYEKTSDIHGGRNSKHQSFHPQPGMTGGGYPKGGAGAVQVRPDESQVLEAGRAEACRAAGKQQQQSSSAAAAGDRKLYSVVFDIGSTGSRVHVFRLRQKTSRECSSNHNQKENDGSGSSRAGVSDVSCLEIEDELFMENHDALSKMADDLPRCIASLEPLYQAAVAYVPAAQQQCTPVEFLATAGLRKLGTAKADTVLAAVEEHFRHGAFWLRGGKASCRILEGEEEGPMAWITVNFLLGRFAALHEPTAAIVDLGGGSTQIVFEPPTPSFSSMHSSFVFERVLGRRRVRAYQHSYNLGLHEATQSLLRQVSASPSLRSQQQTNADEKHVEQLIKARTAMPCFAPGYTDEATGVSNTVTGAVASDFDACVKLFETVVLHPNGKHCPNEHCGIGEVFQPPLEDFTGPFFAFSYIYDVYAPHMNVVDQSGKNGADNNNNSNNNNNVLSLQAMAAAGRERCSSLTLEQIAAMQADPKHNRTLNPGFDCLYHAYIYALLVNGYGLDEHREVHIAKKIDGYETAWALGAGLMTLSKL